MNIEKLMNDPEFKINQSKLISHFISSTISNDFYLKSILEVQIQSLELLKGKTGQELDSSVSETIDKLENIRDNYLKSGMIDVLSVLSDD